MSFLYFHKMKEVFVDNFGFLQYISVIQVRIVLFLNKNYSSSFM